MSYEKHTWVNNETITAAKMNNIEDGIEEAAQSGGGNNYDLVITADNAQLDSVTNFSLTSGNQLDAYNKLIAGEYVRVLIVGDGSRWTFPAMATYESFFVGTVSAEGALSIRFWDAAHGIVVNLYVDQNGDVSHD